MRDCNNCAVCCTGVLSGESYGKEYSLGKPCYYLKDKLCTIYTSRPDVCKDYTCAWVNDYALPDKFDPRITNCLFMQTNTELRVFLDSPDNLYQNDFINFALANNIKMVIYLGQQVVRTVNG